MLYGAQEPLYRSAAIRLLQNERLKDSTKKVVSKNEIGSLHIMMKNLAEHQHALKFSVSCDQLYEYLVRDKPPFACAVAEINDKISGYALFYPGYASWLGLEMKIEDLYVKPMYTWQRGKRGIGTALADLIRQEAVNKKCHRIETRVPRGDHIAIKFIHSLYKKWKTPLRPVEEWRTYRFDLSCSDKNLLVEKNSAFPIIRFAEPKDVREIHNMMWRLAGHQQRTSKPKFSVTLEKFKDYMSCAPSAFKIIVAEANGSLIGYVLFYQGYSSWSGPDMKVEDFYVVPTYRRSTRDKTSRGGGVGVAMANFLKKEAMRHNYARIETRFPMWDTAALQFAEKLSAIWSGAGREVKEWVTFRFDLPTAA